MYSILLQKMTRVGRMSRGSIRNLSLVPLPGLMCLYDEPILSVHWYYGYEQPYIVAFLYHHLESPHDWELDNYRTLSD